MDGQRPSAERAPETARVAPGPILRCPEPARWSVFALGKRHPAHLEEGGVRILVEVPGAEQLAGERPQAAPEKGEPRSGESSSSPLKQKAPSKDGAFVLSEELV